VSWALCRILISDKAVNQNTTTTRKLRSSNTNIKRYTQVTCTYIYIYIYTYDCLQISLHLRMASIVPFHTTLQGMLRMLPDCGFWASFLWGCSCAGRCHCLWDCLREATDFDSKVLTECLRQLSEPVWRDFRKLPEPR